MNKKHVISLLLFILTFSLFLYYMQPGILQHDVVELAAYAEYVVFDEHDASLAWHYTQFDNGAFPWRTGTNYLTTTSFYIFNIFGEESAESAVFITQFLFGSLAVVFLYLFLYEIYNKHFPAVIGALIFGLSTPLFNAVLAKDHGTEFFFAIFAMYLLIKGIKNNSTIYLTTSSINLGLLLWMREAGLLFPVIYFGFYCIYALEKRSLITTKKILAITIPYIILAVGAFYAYVRLLLNNAVSNLNSDLFVYTKEILVSLWTWYPILFFALLLTGFYIGIKNKEKNVIFFTAVSILFFILFTKNATYDIRHLGIYVLFPFSVIIGYALTKLEAKDWKNYVVIAFALIIIVQVFLPGLQIMKDRKEHIYTKEFSESIKQVTDENSVIFIQKDFCIFISYYAKRDCKGIPVDFFTTVNTALLEGKQVYMPYHLGFGFYDDEYKAAIEENYDLNVAYSGNFETFHHADLNPQVYEEMLIEVTKK